MFILNNILIIIIYAIFSLPTYYFYLCMTNIFFYIATFALDLPCLVAGISSSNKIVLWKVLFMLPKCGLYAFHQTTLQFST